MSRFDASQWPALSNHLDQLLGLGAEAQQAYLEPLARESPTLVEELRRLLGARGNDGFAAFLNESPALTRTRCPCRSSRIPLRRSVSICTKTSGVSGPRETKP